MTFLQSASAEAGGGSGYLLFMLLILGVVMYFGMIRPQKKQEKKLQDMQKNMEIGDEVVTNGGIVGRVLNVSPSDETVLLETGSDRSKIRVARWAIQTNNTKRAEMATAQKEAIEQKRKEKLERKAEKQKGKEE